MPKATIAGISRQPVASDRNKMTPTASHMTATKTRNPGLEGRRPIVTGVSGSGGRTLPGPLVFVALLVVTFAGPPPFGVIRPLEPPLCWRVAMDTNVSGRRLRRRR
jgi:hypothetical protein